MEPTTIATLKSLKRILGQAEDKIALTKLEIKGYVRQINELKEEDPEAFAAVFATLPKALGGGKKGKKGEDKAE